MDIYEYLEKNFKLNTREEYRTCDLPIEAKRILCDRGLPKKPLNFLELNINEIEDIGLDEEHIIIGNDCGTNICINHKGEIISVDSEQEYPIRFINRNLEVFLSFIIVYLSYEKALDVADDDETEKIILKLRKEFNMIDANALRNEENWWSIILEQLELGIM